MRERKTKHIENDTFADELMKSDNEILYEP